MCDANVNLSQSQKIILSGKYELINQMNEMKLYHLITNVHVRKGTYHIHTMQINVTQVLT